MTAADDPRPVDELEALFALDALDPDEQDAAELAHGPVVTGLADVTAALAETTAIEPPLALRGRALAAALTARPARTSLEGVTAAEPLATFAAFAAELDTVLAELDADDWQAPAHPAYGSVHDLVAHLVGVEEITLGWCGAGPLLAADDHIAATRATVDALAAHPADELAARWRSRVDEVVTAAAAADPAQPVLAHDIPTDVDGALVLRSFELWSHADDIRRATGRPLPAPDPAAMALLSSRLMRVAGLAVAFRGHELPPGTARFVLTGAGGGTYDVELGPDGDETLTTIVADVVDLCRVAARRLPLDELDVAVDGDAAVADLLLTNVDAFARD